MKRPNRAPKRKLRLHKCSKCGAQPFVEYHILRRIEPFDDIHVVGVHCDSCHKNIRIDYQYATNIFKSIRKTVRKWNKKNAKKKKN